ncbi:MAG: RsmG family class I SAM-dependent methyltransferase [Acidimicrobiia bacterium]
MRSRRTTTSEPGEDRGLLPADDRRALRHILEKARDLGFLGPDHVDAHIGHALAFAPAVAPTPRQALDLGSGGGVPGLVLAMAWPESRWGLVDAGKRRSEFLTWAVDLLGVSRRVDVWWGRAEEMARQPGLRARHDLVVARSFGPPAVTAECGAGFLSLGGSLLVSEPPAPAQGRWDVAALAALGLTDAGLWSERPSIRRLIAVALCPERYPRRTGLPAKRPLFGGTR